MNKKLIKYVSFLIPLSKWRKSFRNHFDIPRKKFEKVYHAQFAEDILFNLLFNQLFKQPIDTIQYLDIGSNMPIIDNNTYNFYLSNAHGVLVEPNPNFKKLTQRKRPRDIFLNKGISVNMEKSADYYDFGENAHCLNTFSEERALKIIKDYPLLQKIKVDLISLEEIFIQYFCGKAPDFISIDVEGLDFEILKTINFNKYRPKLICIEANKIELDIFSRPDNICCFMKENQYVLVADSFINYIFADITQIITDNYTYNGDSLCLKHL